MPSHCLILTLGTNTGSPLCLSYALYELKQSVTIAKLSQTMRTDAVDFPYTSPPFHNIVLIASTSLSYEAMLYECKRIELLCGRTPAQRASRPDVVPLDLDIVLWDNRLCKPRDLSRPYLIEGLRQIFSQS